jgi:hypothetical protein
MQKQSCKLLWSFWCDRNGCLCEEENGVFREFHANFLVEWSLNGTALNLNELFGLDLVHFLILHLKYVLKSKQIFKQKNEKYKMVVNGD